MLLIAPLISPFFKLKFLDSWFLVLSNNFIIFWYSIMYYINLSSSIICCLFSGYIYIYIYIYIYLSFGISVSNPIFSVLLRTDSEVFCVQVLLILVILSAILLLPIRSLGAFAVIWIVFFEVVEDLLKIF